MKPVTVSYLTTGTDYADFKFAAMKSSMRKGEVSALRISGAAVLLLAFALMLFWGGSVFRNLLYILLALIGFAVCGSPDVFIPFFVRKRAFQKYESGEKKILSQTVEFHEDHVSFLSERYSAEVPYTMFYKAYEDGKMFLFYFGINEIRFVPKRAMNNDGCETVRNLLGSQLKDKFQQEGAR